MEEVEGGGLRLGGKGKEGEVDYKTKSGTAWSHSYLNQKPWHPLSYPNQRRKWIAEQTTANRQRRSEEVAREFAQEQEFFRQTALISKKEKEKVEMMKAVSFMYVRPPGYNAESAKAAEVADERKKSDENSAAQESTTTTVDAGSDKGQSRRDKKSRPKDVFGRPLPTEEEFGVLKNAPRLETGMPGRAKPFGIEIRNVRCVRCAAFGHQSGDRECPLKDAIMPNEENRLKRDDPLTTIMAQTDSSEPLKWELKQKPGMSPPRGGFQPDDPNQQIVADEIFDEYGGFLSGGDIPMLLTNFSENKSAKHSKSKSKHRHRSSRAACSEPKNHHRNLSSSPYDSEIDRATKRRVKSRDKKKKVRHAESTISDNSELGRRGNQSSSSDSVVDRARKRRAKGHHVESNRSGGTDLGRHRDKSISSDSEVDTTRKRRAKGCHKESNRYDNSDLRHHRDRSISSDFEVDTTRKRGAKGRHKESNRYESSSLGCQRHGSTSSDSEVDRTRKGRERGRHKESNRYNSSDLGRQRDRSMSSDSEVDRTRKKRAKGRQKESNRYDSSDLGRRHGDQSSSDSEADRARERRRENRHKKKKKKSHRSDSSASEKSDSDYHHQNRRKHRHC